MTQAPDRERERRRPPLRDERPVRVRRPEGPARPPVKAAAKPAGVDKSAWSKGVVISNAALILVVAIVGIRYTQSQRDDPAGETLTVPQSSAAAVPEPSAPASEAAPVAEPASAPVAPAAAVVAPPVVKATFRSDFARGDAWPVGADLHWAGRVAWPMAVEHGQLTSGAPLAAGAVSSMQKWMRSDVRRIGARVRFAPNHPGSVALTAWFTSVRDTSGTAQPRTGMRLVATPGSWKLVALTGAGEQVMGQGTYARQGRTASFDLVRKGATVWVTDPAGTVTQVADARIARFSGPWAAWELREDKAGQRPAALTAVWAG